MQESIAMAGLLNSICPTRKRPPSAGEPRLPEGGVFGAFRGEVASKQEQWTHLRRAERDDLGRPNAASERGITIGHSRSGKREVGFEGSCFRLVAERNQPLLELRFDPGQRLRVSGPAGPEHARPHRAGVPAALLA